MPGDARLTYEAHWLDHLYPGSGDGSFIDVKRFCIQPPSNDPTDVIRLLLAHPEYRDHYCSPENISAGGPLHGPYEADRIAIADFHRVSPEEAEATLRTWAAELQSDSPAELAHIQHVLSKALQLIRPAAHVMHLRDLRGEAEHDWGWVLGDFHEFVAIARDGTLHLVVASDD